MLKILNKNNLKYFSLAGRKGERLEKGNNGNKHVNMFLIISVYIRVLSLLVLQVRNKKDDLFSNSGSVLGYIENPVYSFILFPWILVC